MCVCVSIVYIDINRARCPEVPSTLPGVQDRAGACSGLEASAQVGQVRGSNLNFNPAILWPFDKQQLNSCWK